MKKRRETDLYTNVCIADLQGLNALDRYTLLVGDDLEKRGCASGHIVCNLGVVKDKCTANPKGISHNNDGLRTVVTKSVGSAGLSLNGKLIFVCIVVRGFYGSKIIGNAVTNGTKIRILYYDLHGFLS